MVEKKEETKIIRNKYDVYDVEFHLNEYVNQYMETNLKAVKSESKEYYKQTLGAILSVFILLSYFHKSPFPLDKPLIFICTFIYFIFVWILEFYKKFYVKDIFSEFYVSKSSLPKNISKISKFFVKDLGFIVLSSRIKLFSSDYTLNVEINGSVTEKTIQYNEFIHSDGKLAEEKFKKFIETLLNSLK